MTKISRKLVSSGTIPLILSQDWDFVLCAWVEDSEKWKMFYGQELGGCYDMGGWREKTVCFDPLS